MTLDSLLNRTFDRFYKPLIVLAAIGLAGLLARRPSPLFLMLLVAAGVGLVLLRRPELGLIGLVVCALLVPFSIGTGTQTRLHAAVLLIPLLVAVWLLDMVQRRDLRLAPSPTNTPLIVFCLVAILSFIAGNLPWNYFATTAPMPAQVGGLAIFLLSAVAFLLMGNQIRDLRWLERLTWLFIVLGGVYIAGRVLPPLGAVVIPLYQQGATGSIFWVWLVALTAGQALFNGSLGLRWRAALLLLAVTTLAVGWFQGRGWASGWGPPAVSLGVLIWLRFPRLGPMWGSVSLVLLVRSASSLLFTAMADAHGTLFTWEARKAAWRIVLEVVSASNPVLGLGPANYYHAVQIVPILGWYVKFNSHNQYVDIFAQVGIVGFLAVVWLLSSIGLLGWRLRDVTSNGFVHGYVYACLGGLAGMVVSGVLGDWFLPFVYNIGIQGFRASVLAWMFLGGLVAIRRMESKGHTE